MPQVLRGMSNSRISAALSSGPPKGPLGLRVSATRQGVTGMNWKDGPAVAPVTVKTAPAPFMALELVVPYRLPAGSSIRPATGVCPSVQFAVRQKACSTVSWPAGSNLNTTPGSSAAPFEKAPPSAVVPYRLPAASRVTPATGALPSVQLTVEVEVEQK